MSEPAFDVIDLDRYPIHQAGEARDALIAQVRADLAKDGCAVIKGFLSGATRCREYRPLNS